MDFDPAFKRRRLSTVQIKRPRGRPRRVRPDENVVPEKDLTNFIHLSSAPDFSFLGRSILLQLIVNFIRDAIFFYSAW